MTCSLHHPLFLNHFSLATNLEGKKLPHHHLNLIFSLYLEPDRAQQVGILTTCIQSSTAKVLLLHIGIFIQGELETGNKEKEILGTNHYHRQACKKVNQCMSEYLMLVWIKTFILEQQNQTSDIKMLSNKGSILVIAVSIIANKNRTFTYIYMRKYASIFDCLFDEVIRLVFYSFSMNVSLCIKIMLF